jgi:hypothetical protein
MNLHGIVSPYIGAVNPLIPVSVLVNIGPTTALDGTQTPVFASALAVIGQVQPISTRDLAQLEGINLGGVRWKIYLNGEVDSIVRAERKGGDLVIIPTGRHRGTWLVVQVLEQFSDWCCAAIVFQNTNVPISDSTASTDFSDPDNSQFYPGIL